MRLGLGRRRVGHRGRGGGRAGVRVPEQDGVDPVAVAAQGETLARAEVPDFDGRVDAAAGEEGGVKVEADDAVRVALERADAFPRAPVPNAKRVVHAAGDELHLVELQGTQRPGVALEAADLLTGLEVPYSSCAVIGTRDEDREWKVRECFAELQAHDAIGVPL